MRITGVKIHYSPIHMFLLSCQEVGTKNLYVHCSDPTAPAENNDRLNKVHNLVNELQQNFQAVYTPGSYLSIDEAMIKYNGRLLWKQYMPKNLQNGA